jgi:non-ribosomal peptide synthetase component F
LIALYTAFSAAKPSPLREPAPQYADFSLWQRARLSDDVLAPHLAWWKRNLSGELPRLAWPNAKARPAVQTYNGATEMLFLPSEVVDPLRAFAEGESATLFMALAAGFFTLLYRYTAQTDLIVGMPTAARTPETEGIMGYFLNLLPVRVDLSGSPSFREVLRRVRSSVVDALDHGSVPLLRLLEQVRPPHDPTRTPLFQIMISLEPPMPPIDPAWDLTQAKVSSGSTKMDMYLNLDTRPDGLMAPIMYNPDLLEAAGVRQMFAHWRSILEGGVAEPDRPVMKLRLVEPPQEQLEAPTPASSLGGRLMGWLKR